MDLGRKEILNNGCARCNSPVGRNGVGLDSTNDVFKNALALFEGLVVGTRDVSVFGKQFRIDRWDT